MSITEAPPRLLTPDDVLKIPEGKYCELVDGVLVEKPMGFRSQYVGARISWVLINYCDPIDLAHVLVENGMVCFPSKPEQMRRPDVTCILTARMPVDQIGDGFLKIRPDLVIEVISPNDKVIELEEKLDDYRDAEIPLIWLVYPSLKRIRVIRLNAPAAEFGALDELTGEPVLPGFRCRVIDLLERKRP